MFSKLPNSLQGTMQPEAPPWCLGSHRWLNKCWESIQHLITQQLENFTRTRKKAVLVIDSMQKLIYDCTSKLEKVKRLEKDLEQILSRPLYVCLFIFWVVFNILCPGYIEQLTENNCKHISEKSEMQKCHQHDLGGRLDNYSTYCKFEDIHGKSSMLGSPGMTNVDKCNNQVSNHRDTQTPTSPGQTPLLVLEPEAVSDQDEEYTAESVKTNSSSSNLTPGAIAALADTEGNVTFTQGKIHTQQFSHKSIGTCQEIKTESVACTSMITSAFERTEARAAGTTPPTKNVDSHITSNFTRSLETIIIPAPGDDVPKYSKTLELASKLTVGPEKTETCIENIYRENVEIYGCKAHEYQVHGTRFSSVTSRRITNPEDGNRSKRVNDTDNDIDRCREHATSKGIISDPSQLSRNGNIVASTQNRTDGVLETDCGVIPIPDESNRTMLNNKRETNFGYFGESKPACTSENSEGNVPEDVNDNVISAEGDTTLLSDTVTLDEPSTEEWHRANEENITANHSSENTEGSLGVEESQTVPLVDIKPQMRVNTQHPQFQEKVVGFFNDRAKLTSRENGPLDKNVPDRLRCRSSFRPESSRAVVFPVNRGEFHIEAVRLSTFRDMPISVPVPATRLARAGFYYSGDGDEVVCFRCDGRLREWARGDDPAVRHRNFYPDCPLMRGTDKENDPILPTNDAVFNCNLDPFPNLANATSTPLDHDSNASSLLSSQHALSRSPGISSPEVASPQTTPLESSTAAHSGVASGVCSNEDTSALPNTSHLPTRTPSGMRNESDRLATFVNWPSGASVRPRDLTRAGFFYVGTEDRVQCAFCEGVLRNWEPSDQPMQEHRRYLSTCPFVLGLEVGNIPLEEPSTALPLAVSESQRQAVGGSTTGSENTTNGATLGILTARPRHERYAIESTRVQTFANWPPSRIPRPGELARAGFFYAGFGDNVKCFFCDGGLRNWEPQDDPWTEHARWFPRCGFVRQCKGDAFIHMIKEQTSSNNPPPHAQTQTQRPQGVPGSYHVEAREIKARLDTPTVQAVLDMGFSRDTVRQAIEQRLRNAGDDFPSAASLLDAVLNIEDEMNRQMTQGAAAMAVMPQEEPGQQSLNAALSEAPPRETAQKTSQTQNTEKQSKKDKKKKKKKQDVPVPKDSDDRETKSLLEENQRLKEERTCKICMDEEVSVVFLPCGHLVACVQCAPALRNCAICRAAIKGTVRSILS